MKLGWQSTCCAFLKKHKTCFCYLLSASHCIEREEKELWLYFTTPTRCVHLKTFNSLFCFFSTIISFVAWLFWEKLHEYFVEIRFRANIHTRAFNKLFENIIKIYKFPRKFFFFFHIFVRFWIEIFTFFTSSTAEKVEKSRRKMKLRWAWKYVVSFFMHPWSNTRKCCIIHFLFSFIRKT
jgi:hypothetical protein